MANLRLQDIKVFDSVSIEAQFSDSLDPILNTSNILIVSNLPGIPNPEVMSVEVALDILRITTRPLTPFALYTITFKSGNIKFKSANGKNFLLEDGITNVTKVLGQEDPSNPITPYLINYLKDNIYDYDFGTIVRDLINLQATRLSAALYDIRQLRNDNYLSVTITDEQQIRGVGPYDRLIEEGVYELICVGKTPTGTTLPGIIISNDFPAGPITLQAVKITKEQLIAGHNTISTFDQLTLTVSKAPVTKLSSVIIAYQNGLTATYDISQFGYRIENSRYDTLSSTLLSLQNNQFKLSESSLDAGFIPPKPGDTVIVSYEYKNLGRYIDPNSVAVVQTLQSIRENTDGLSNKFSLTGFPIVNSSGVAISSAGVIFLDPSANPPFSSTHPAFLTELPFKFDALPGLPGEYSIDYPTGTVYVFGADSKGDGTGDFPPVATYFYQHSFSSRLDYTFDPDFVELVASPVRELIGQVANITYQYEDNLVEGIDFIPQIHQEVLNERIQNRLVSSIAVQALNTPITNVFRVYNETTGEVYNVSRWNDSTIFFSYKQAPNIDSSIRERANFTNFNNETLIVNQELNVNGLRFLELDLLSDRIFSASEDTIGASFNSSVSFSRTDIFQQEIYFDGQILTLNQNLSRLSLNQYFINYEGGIIYVAVPNSQNLDLGTVNYKNYIISPNFSHVNSVSEIYQSISSLAGINKRIQYTSFGEGQIIPVTFDLADERFLNQDTTLPLQVFNNTITVSDDIKNVRGIYDYYNLVHFITPTNFADGATISDNIITLSPIAKQELLTISTGHIINATFITAGANISSISSIVRVSDGQAFEASSFNNYQIQLDGYGSPAVGNIVQVNYDLSLNGAATPIVDYDRGEYFIDYDYVADEILISYEYGDNCLDFRSGDGLDSGQTYYVSYKVGALRQALLQNFGTLVDLSILNSFDTSLPRENYRDALTAALQSFTKGPTIAAMKSIVSHISHIDPEIIEGAFESWSLGISHLFQAPINYSSDLTLLPAKFDNGVLIDKPKQFITFPISSNLRLEEGSMEMWVIPEWDGLDNDATLNFTITQDGYVLDPTKIYIGATSIHPTYDINNIFQLNKNDITSIGLPALIFIHTGIFIYYSTDIKQWKILAKNRTNKSTQYQINIKSSGEVYNVGWVPGLNEINDILQSGTNSIFAEFNIDGYDGASPDGYQDTFNILDGYHPGDGYLAGFSFDGIQFMADNEHYLFDFGNKDNNRFSIYKDGSGYLNFRVFDKGNRINKVNQYKVSTDISNWTAGSKHHIATSWRLNTYDRRDEMHLFIDGLEVPNIMKYGGRPIASSTDRFRTVKPEIIAGTIPKNTIAGNDLLTTAGSTIVSSGSIDFTLGGINPGDILSITEIGFGTYTIISVSGGVLHLSTAVPSSLPNARFSVNPYTVNVASEVDLYDNVLVTILHNGIEKEIPGSRAVIPGYTVYRDLLNQNHLTLLGDALVGDQIIIRTVGLNHRRCREQQFIWGNTSNILKTQLPPPINLDQTSITSVLLPSISIGSTNATFVAGHYIATLIPTQPSNNIQGRTLLISINNNNVNFATPVSVTINGNTFEVLTFTQFGSKTSVNKYTSLTSIIVSATPLISSKNTISITITENFPITYSEGNNLYPIIRYSYQTQSGTSLSGIGNTLTDLNGYFTASNVGQSLVIASPPSVAGTYLIISRIDNNNIIINTSLATFSNGSYSVFNTTIGRSGFQNGFFTLEQAGSTNTPYHLPQGYYAFDYPVYLEVPFDPLNNKDGYIGSDIFANKQANAIIDEFIISSKFLTDVRVGEIIADNAESITTDFTRLKELEPNITTLMLLHFNELPFTNESDYWVSFTRDYLQSGNSVNSNFNTSLLITDHPLILDNEGLLTTNSEGSIEFWVSPKYDTGNDPNFRFYFDASSSAIENQTSISSASVKTSGRINQLISIRLQTDIQNEGFDYGAGATISPDFQTITLAHPLPYQQTPVKISYIPSGLQGNRLSIYKDDTGFITFNVEANGDNYQVRQPIFWSRDTWHRILCTFKFNRLDQNDEIRMFVDGEERGVIRFGSGLLFGQNIVFGQSQTALTPNVLVRNINFKDPLNQLYIGSDFHGVNNAYARIDNLRISNISRRPVVVGGQALDVNYNSNIATVFPVVNDVFTTYLMDFETMMTKPNDFSLLRDEVYGIFNFTINIIDSFGIVLSNAKIKQILETLIHALAPAQAKITLNYLT